MITELERNRLIRQAVLEYLATRNRMAFEAPLILRAVTRSRLLDFEPTREEVESALAFLLSSGWVTSIPSKFGKGTFYQATAAGVLAFENSEI